MSVSFEFNESHTLKNQAFASLSSELASCVSIDEIRDVLNRHLKYVIDFTHFRLRISSESEQVCLLIKRSEFISDIVLLHEMQQYERNVLETGIPKIYHYQSLKDESLHEQLSEEHQLWVWNFSNKDSSINRNVITSVVVEKSVRFGSSDIAFLKMISEIVATKVRVVQLLNKLRAVTANQEDIIAQKTKSLLDVNSALINVMLLQSHAMREPLTRVLSIATHLIEQGIGGDFAVALEAAANDLDKSIKSGTALVEKELKNIESET